MKVNKLYFLVMLLLIALVTSSCIRLPGWGPIDGGCSKGHQFGDWEPRLSDPCAEGAVQKRICSACYFAEKRVVPKGHQYVDRVCTVCSAIAPSEGLEFAIEEEQFYTVVGIGACIDTMVVIPTEYKGLPVKSISAFAFQGCESIEQITIPDSITTIGYEAFSGCSGLTSITVPDSVTEIDDGAFEECANLESIVIPNGVASIKRLTFYHSNSLSAIYYKGTAVEWAEKLSYDTQRIPQLYISYDFTTVYCYSETEPGYGNYWHYVDGVPTAWAKPIPYYCIIDRKDEGWIIADYLGDAMVAEDLVIPETVNGYKVTAIGDGAFDQFAELLSVTLPSGVTKIGHEAFAYCLGLSHITIPAGVTWVSNAAFTNCDSLKTVYYGGTAAQWEKTAYDKWGNPSVPEHATVYCYSETDPGDGGNYWRYVDGVPTVWPQ